MRNDNSTNQPELNLDTREALVSAYTSWNKTFHWDVHLTLRPKPLNQNRLAFTREIGCTFADVERELIGQKLFNKKRRHDCYRIHRSVFIEKEHIDIHAHVFLRIPAPKTHVAQYWDADIKQYLSKAWSKRNHLDADEEKRNFHWQLIATDEINAYPVKECLWLGNTENWDFRCSWIPKTTD